MVEQLGWLSNRATGSGKEIFRREADPNHSSEQSSRAKLRRGQDKVEGTGQMFKTNSRTTEGTALLILIDPSPTRYFSVPYKTFGNRSDG